MKDEKSQTLLTGLPLSLFNKEKFNINDQKEDAETGKITESDRLLAGKQILLGIAVVYVITALVYAWSPAQGNVLLEICKMTLPPLATLIIAFYFNNKS